MTSTAIINKEHSARGFLIESLLLFFPLLTIRGDTNNNYITFAYIFFLTVVILFSKIYYEDFQFIFYNYKSWFFLLVWGVYILNKSPDSKLATLYYLFTIVSPFFLFQAINNIKFDENLLSKLFQILFFVGSILGLASLLYLIVEGYDPKARLTSFWTAFNMVSGYLMILFMFNLSFLINRRKDENIIFYSISIFLILFGMFLTQTRGVWVATVIAIVFFFIKRPKIIIPSIIFLGFFAYFFSGVIGERFFTVINFTKDASAVGRMQAWLSSAILIAQNPLLGYGFDSYIAFRDDVFSYYVVKVLHSHNTYLRAWLEMGLIGSVVYFSFFIRGMYFSFKYKNKEFISEYKRYIDGLQLTFLGLVIIFNFEPYFSIYDNSCIVIWMVISISFVLKRISENYQENPEDSDSNLISRM